MSTETTTGSGGSDAGAGGTDSGQAQEPNEAAKGTPKPPAGAPAKRDPSERIVSSSRDDATPRTRRDSDDDRVTRDDPGEHEHGSDEGSKASRTARKAAPQAGTADDADSGDWKVEDLPKGAQKLIADLRKENGAARTKADKASQQAKASEDKFSAGVEAFLKAIGLTPDAEQEEADPQKLLDEVTDLYREKTVELAVFRKAAGLGGDAESLLDSRGFLTKAFALDPGDEGFEAAVGELITEAVQTNPKVRAATERRDDASEGDSSGARRREQRSGGEFSGGPAERGPEQWTVDDYRAARHKNRDGAAV